MHTCAQHTQHDAHVCVCCSFDYGRKKLEHTFDRTFVRTWPKKLAWVNSVFFAHPGVFYNVSTKSFQQIINTTINIVLTSFQQFPGRVWPQNFTTCKGGLSRTFFVSTQFSQFAHFPKMCRLCVGRLQTIDSRRSTCDNIIVKRTPTERDYDERPHDRHYHVRGLHRARLHSQLYLLRRG